MKQFLIACVFLLLFSNGFAQEKMVDQKTNDSEQIFTSKDKDYLQLWYYEQLLKMDLNEESRDGYLSLLNYYTYKMSRLGLPKYKLTDSERKKKFDELVVKLN